MLGQAIKENIRTGLAGDSPALQAVGFEIAGGRSCTGVM